jgi:type I restriction enzyme M protein
LKAGSESVLYHYNADPNQPDFDELRILDLYIELTDMVKALKKSIKEKSDELDALAYSKYPTLTEEEVKVLVIEDKWFATLEKTIRRETVRVSQTLTGRIRQLAERYATPLPQLTDEVATLAARVDGHLKKMGAVWK